MRLLILASASVIHARRWAGWFSGRGHDIRLATLEPYGGETGPYEYRLPSRLPFDALRYPLAVPSLKKLIKEFSPELVNAHFVPGYGFLAALVSSARPLAVTAWGSDVLVSPRKSPLHRWRARFALSRAALVTCDARVLADELLRLGVSEGKILTVPMGIDPQLFHSPPGGRPEFDAGRGSAGRPAVVVSTRRLEKVYDLATLVRAAVQLKDEGWNFRVILAGDGSRRAGLERAVRRDGLSAIVEFAGELTHQALASLLAGSDLYVSTATSDSTSVSLLEALAAGLFPVVTDLPGNREWIGHGRNGLLFPAGDHRALANCLVRAFEDRGLRENAGRIYIALVREKAVWQDNMELVERKFIELAGKP
ncbi:MAG: glycosyltransferase [Candidatus Glassbacteria bacterium]